MDPFFGYVANYLIDNKILDVEAPRANHIEEVDVAQTMLERVARRCFCLRPERLAGNPTYGVGRMLKWPATHSGLGQVGPV
jgi:hypothetical protein